MKLSAKTALGIDISDGWINLALLKKDAHGIKLLKAASAPVPEGTTKNGIVEDPELLFKSIKRLITRNRMRASQAALSLFTQPVLIQIIEMPKQVPTNIGKFVQNEVKQCVALSGKEIALDFCGTGLMKRSSKRLFAVATDSQKVIRIAKACNQVHLNVEVIEPPLLAYARALYDKKIAGRFDCNVLMAIFHGGALTLCVFREQSLDFVTTKNISKEKSENDELCLWLAEEINAIVKFYDVEVPDSLGKWEITVLADSVQLPEDAEKSLKAQVACTDLKVNTGENVFQDTSVGENNNSHKSSLVAVGLAMKLLGKNGSNLQINLFPPKEAAVKAVKKRALVIANIIASLILLMVLANGALCLMTKKVNERIARVEKTELSKDMHKLLEEEELVEKQISTLSKGLERMKGILSSRRDLQWHKILNDIRSATPGNVRITNLFSRDDSRMYMEGLASSYESINLFVKMLSKSDYIDSAALIGTEKDSRHDGLVKYKINCSLISVKER